MGFRQRQEELRLHISARPWAFTTWCTVVVATMTVLECALVVHQWISALVPGVLVWAILMWIFIKEYRAEPQRGRHDAP